MVQMIVSRRSYLLSRPSGGIMRACGRAASVAGLEAIAKRQAEARFAALMRDQPKPANLPVFLPPSLYDEADRQGYDMDGYAKTSLIPVR